MQLACPKKPANVQCKLPHSDPSRFKICLFGGFVFLLFGSCVQTCVVFWFRVYTARGDPRSVILDTQMDTPGSHEV